MRLGRQFSVRHMLALTLVIAVGILAWQRFIYVHPAHKNQLYEKAPIIRGGAMKIGDHQVKVDIVSRTDRDMSLLVEDGSGQSVQRKPKNAKVLERSGAWLDTVQIEFELQGDADLYGFRVFNHETREIVYGTHKCSGYRLDGGDTLQLHCVGKKLPDRLDLFVRMKTYDKGTAPAIVPPTADAKFSTPYGDVRVSRIIKGMIGYTQSEGFIVSEKEPSCGVLLRFEGKHWPNDQWYEVVTVTKQGQRVYSDFGIRFPGSYVLEDGRAELIRPRVDLLDIQHFELRPRGEYRKFVFEDIQLPNTSAAKFVAPPSVLVTFDGAKSEVSVPELQPLDLRLQLHEGNCVDGVVSNGNAQSITMSSNPTSLGTELTLIGHLRGVGSLDWEITTLPDSFRAAMTSASGPIGHKFSALYRMSASDLKAVEIKLSPP